VARKDPEHFDDIEPVLVYMARKLRHALRVEELLTGAGIDYAVETDTYSAGFILRTQRTGAFFYVDPVEEARAKATLEAEGFQLKGSVEGAGTR
jgi:hypothetical protein